MKVYCGSETCIHNNNGVCENKYPTGTEAINLIEILDGSVICSDQEDREDLEEED